jgi:hypothetical protein
MRFSAVIGVLFSVLCLSGCKTFDEEDDCYYIPWWRDCDTIDDEPTEFTLTINVLTSDPFPMDVKIYNRTLAFGIGNLFTTVSTDGSSTHILPEGRYTAEMTFSDGSVDQQEFRVHNRVNEYCEGTCYEIMNDDVTMTGP